MLGVVNTKTGALEQFNDYYPYGMPHASNRGTGINRYKHGGKELTTELGLNLYDYHARLYDPILPRFLQPDPMAGKYHPLSPNIFCASNPINFSDPTGLDIYSIDENGYITNVELDNNKDIIQFVDETNKIIEINGENQIIEMQYGSIEKIDQVTGTDINGNKYTTLMFFIKGDENASNFFETACKPENTKVEWSRTKIGNPAKKKNVVGNSHSEHSTYQASLLNNNSYWITFDVHYHPNGGAPSKADREVEIDIHKNNTKALLRIYRNGQYENITTTAY